MEFLRATAPPTTRKSSPDAECAVARRLFSFPASYSRKVLAARNVQIYRSAVSRVCRACKRRNKVGSRGKAGAVRMCDTFALARRAHRRDTAAFAAARCTRPRYFHSPRGESTRALSAGYYEDKSSSREPEVAPEINHRPFVRRHRHEFVAPSSLLRPPVTHFNQRTSLVRFPVRDPINFNGIYFATRASAVHSH